MVRCQFNINNSYWAFLYILPFLIVCEQTKISEKIYLWSCFITLTFVRFWWWWITTQCLWNKWKNSFITYSFEWEQTARQNTWGLHLGKMITSWNCGKLLCMASRVGLARFGRLLVDCVFWMTRQGQGQMGCP